MGIFFCLIFVVYLGHGIFHPVVAFGFPPRISFWEKPLNPFRAPEPHPTLNPSNFVPKKGFPVVKGLSSQIEEPQKNMLCTCIVARFIALFY